ncbi:hypothetical protein EB796_006949 [Bugula neritina]|uniref:Uncharacterized protein n=1 Tax=Bugula neritina TaxID=10212 RepID=A0A7J7K7X6_BUGNE|nr:hypothetical protein EB796_006949 [Bugula neritina]
MTNIFRDSSSRKAISTPVWRYSIGAADVKKFDSTLRRLLLPVSWSLRCFNAASRQPQLVIYLLWARQARESAPTTFCIYYIAGSFTSSGV